MRAIAHERGRRPIEVHFESGARRFLSVAEAEAITRALADYHDRGDDPGALPDEPGDVL